MKEKNKIKHNYLRLFYAVGVWSIYITRAKDVINILIVMRARRAFYTRRLGFTYLKFKNVNYFKLFNKLIRINNNHTTTLPQVVNLSTCYYKSFPTYHP